jgi:ribonuclease III, bacterial
MLCQFGIMGSIYMEKVMGIANPRVGLANVGTEEHKGGVLQNEAYRLLSGTNLNFVGNIEGRDVPGDACDVLVADGFSGNLILKTYEGAAIEIMARIKAIFGKNIKNKLAAAMIMGDLKGLAKEMDYHEYGGAPIIGISRPVFKAHGSSKARTMKNAIKLTKQFTQANVINEIEKNISIYKPKIYRTVGEIRSGRKNDLSQLEEKLGYKFRDIKYLRTGLTHSSYANEFRKLNMKCNERQEFLGDAVLSIVVSDYIYRNCPMLPEGDLTKLRAALVCEKSLAGYARSIGLGKYLLLSRGERHTNGQDRSSILADAFEAVIAAIYLDGGMEEARKFIYNFVVPDIKGGKLIKSKDYRFKDYKTESWEARHTGG